MEIIHTGNKHDNCLRLQEMLLLWKNAVTILLQAVLRSSRMILWQNWKNAKLKPKLSMKLSVDASISL